VHPLMFSYTALLTFALLFIRINPLQCQECSHSIIEHKKVNDKFSISIEENNMGLSEKEALIKATNHYIETLNQIGASQTDYQSKDIEPLCSVNCKKIRNGKVLFEGKDFFAAQLDAGKEWLGTWKIDVKEILISTGSRAAVIRYELATEKEDHLVIIAILRFDSNYLISEINEVHNKLEE